MGGFLGGIKRFAGDIFNKVAPKPAVAAPPPKPVIPYGPGGASSGSGLGQAQRISQDVRPAALQDTISWSEGTAKADGTPNYQMRYGDSKGSAGTLDTSAPHPVTPRPSPWGGSSGSNASGAYQFLDSTWGEMNDGVNVPMTPANQDASVQRLIEQRTDYDYNEPFEDQVEKLSGQWASFPNELGVSDYNQPAHDRQELIDIYNGRYSARENDERLRVYGMR